MTNVPGHRAEPTPVPPPPTPPPAEGRRRRSDAAPPPAPPEPQADPVVTDPAREKFGGVNLGACIFGWVVAVGVSVLLTGVVGAVVTAVGSEAGISQSEAERASGTIGLATAIALLVVLTLGYYSGGYVAGRMSRFDGGRQGLAVWVLGFVLTLVAIGLGALFGSQYDVFDRVDLPRVYLSDDEIGWGAVVTALAVLAATLVAAWFGGVIGRRYHSRVDKVTARGWEDAAH